MAAIPKEMIIEKLKMLPHPEGGYYVETYRSTEEVSPADGRGPRSASTSILFLLGSGDISHLHRIKSDEMWHFHQGASLTIYELDETTRTLRATQLGPNIFKGEVLQHVVRANTWFASHLTDPNAEYGLVGCTVAPGFDFADFELAHRDHLIEAFSPNIPQDMLHRLTVDPATLTQPAAIRRRLSSADRGHNSQNLDELESLPAPGMDVAPLGS